MKTREITISDLLNMAENGISTFSVKDNSPRGCKTVPASMVKVGDKVVIDNYFHLVVDDPAEEIPAEVEEAPVKVEDLRNKVDSIKARSAWMKGVKLYASDLLDGLEEAIDGGWFDAEDIKAPKLLEKQLLNGASDWDQYSWGGCSLCYNGQIAKRLCTASELKKTQNGAKDPNPREQWLDTQARALYQAARLILEEASKL